MATQARAYSKQLGESGMRVFLAEEFHGEIPGNTGQLAPIVSLYHV